MEEATDLRNRDPQITSLSTIETLKGIIEDVLPLFLRANVAVLAACAVLFAFDVGLLLLGKISPADRIIDQKVVLALIGATAAELSVIVVTAIKMLK